MTRAIVATRQLRPGGFAPEWDVPQGAEEADGMTACSASSAIRSPPGADWIKFYADYLAGPGARARPPSRWTR